MPLDTTRNNGVSSQDAGLFAGLTRQLPEETRELFTDQHLAALKEACGKLRWGDHPVNIRVSIRTLFRRYYIVLIAGPERRSAERRVEERKYHRFSKVGNYLFLGALALLGIYALIFIESLLFISLTQNFLN